MLRFARTLCNDEWRELILVWQAHNCNDEWREIITPYLSCQCHVIADFCGKISWDKTYSRFGKNKSMRLL
jgi:hypothetical protein